MRPSLAEAWNRALVGRCGLPLSLFSFEKFTAVWRQKCWWVLILLLVWDDEFKSLSNSLIDWSSNGSTWSSLVMICFELKEHEESITTPRFEYSTHGWIVAEQQRWSLYFLAPLKGIQSIRYSCDVLSLLMVRNPQHTHLHATSTPSGTDLTNRL
jgi:hypothetical protein